MENRVKVTVFNEDGEECECEVLFTFEIAETKANYVAYTDNSLDEDGNTQLYVAIFDPNLDRSELRPVETEEEWEIIEHILDELQSK